MPRTPTRPAVKVESTPLPSSSISSDASDTSTPTKSRKGMKGSVWTSEEQLQLFHFAINRNGRSWGDAVPGKTGSQACSLWIKRLLPYIEKAVTERGS